jgi:hypothetical protein
VNQDPRRNSFNQTNQLNNFLHKHNTGNTYSSIHKNNISYNSSKNQIESKLLNAKKNSLNNKVIMESISKQIIIFLKELYEKYKIIDCIYLCKYFLNRIILSL